MRKTRKRRVRQEAPSNGAWGLLMGAGILLVAGCATVESQLGPIGNGNGKGVAGVGGEGATLQSAGIDCPGVTVRSGASAWQIPAGSTPSNVRYQGSVGQLARECAVLGESMTMRVGVEGRIVVGPKGEPGTVEVPLRIALVEEGPKPKPVWSRFYNVTVNVPPNTSQAIFSHVEDDLTFALPPDRDVGNYVVYVGFDPQGAAAARSKTKAPAKARPKSTPATAARPAPRPKSPPPPPAKSPAQEQQQQPQFEPPPQAQPQTQPQTQPQFEPPPQDPPSDSIFAPPPGHSG